MENTPTDSGHKNTRLRASAQKGSEVVYPSAPGRCGPQHSWRTFPAQHPSPSALAVPKQQLVGKGTGEKESNNHNSFLTLSTKQA